MTGGGAGAGGGATGGRWHGLPLAAVLVGLLVWLWPVIGGRSTLFYRDLYRQYMGTARLLSGEAGIVPDLLWDPLLNGGQPLLGNPNRFVLYPTRGLYRLVDAVTGLNLEIVLHLLLGAVGAFLLARRLRLGPWPAAVASLAWSLGGISVSLTSHLGRFIAFQWMPLAFLAAEGLARGRRRDAWWAVLVGVIGLQWLSGGFEVVLATAATVLGWAAARAGPSTGRAVGRAGAALAAGTGLAAVQVIPAAAMVLRSDRSGLLGEGSILYWSVHPLRLLELAVPGLFGPIDVAEVTGRYWGERLVDGGIPYFSTLYLGAAALVLALYGARGRGADRRLRRLLVIAAAGGIVLALGRHLPGAAALVAALHRIVIVRFPVKATVLLAAPVALLAGFGAERVLASGAGRAMAATAALAACAGLAWAVTAAAPELAQRVLAALFGEAVPGMTAGVAAALGHTALALAGLAVVLALPRKAWTGPLLALVVAADLGTAASAFLPRGPRWMLREPPPAVALVKAAARGGRFYRAPDPIPMALRLPADRAWASAMAYETTLDRYLGATYGIPMIFHPDDARLATHRYAALARRVAVVPPARLRAVLELADVRAVMGPGAAGPPWLTDRVPVASRAVSPLTLARTAFPHGRAWFVGRFRRVTGAEAAARAVTAPGFDPRAVVILDGAPRVPRLPFGPETGLGVFRIAAPGAGWVVFSVPWAPGMEVDLDGRRVPAIPADGPFTAAAVGAGPHRVRLIYRPPEVAAGVAVSVLTLLVLLGLMARPRPARGRPR